MSNCDLCGKPAEAPKPEDLVFGVFCDECLRGVTLEQIGESVRSLVYNAVQPNLKEEDNLSQYAQAPGQPAPTQEQYDGLLVGLEPRQGGWTQFKVQQQGRQYPVGVSTKLPQLIQQATALMGQEVSVIASVTHGPNINPNNGQPYVNRTLQQIRSFSGGGAQPEAYTQTLTQQAPAQPSQQRQDFIPQAVKDYRIMRQTATKVAAHFLPYLAPEARTVDALILICEDLVDYYVNGGPPRADDGVTVNTEYYSSSDEDIPYLPTIDGLGN